MASWPAGSAFKEESLDSDHFRCSPIMWDPTFPETVPRPDDFDVRAAYHLFRSLRPWLTALIAFYLFFLWQIAPRLRNLRLNKAVLTKLSLIWNSFNAVVSLYILVLLFPDFVRSFRQGWYAASCRIGTFYTDAWSGYGMYLFAMSKIWELGDTVLLVLRGRQPAFLHYFHHAAVIFQVVFTFYNAGAMARMGAVMNAIVHTVMYSYFAAVSVWPRIRRFGCIVTSLQMVQFTLACTGAVFVSIYELAGYECETDLWVLPLHLAVICAFFRLFADFYNSAYVHGVGRHVDEKRAN